jgi:hypothetical protein
MPKRWLVVTGASYTWEFVDEENEGDPQPGHRVVLAKSNESWETPQEVEAAIEEMKGNRDVKHHFGSSASKPSGS